MKLYKASMAILIVFAAVLIILTMLQVYVGKFDAYEPLVYLILIIFCVAQFICLFSMKLNKKNIGFYLLHTGLIVFLVSIFIYKVIGIKVQTAIPVNSTTYSTIGRENGEMVNLGFEIGAKDFEVTKYDPLYSLYQRNNVGEWKEVKSEVEPDESDVLDFEKYGEIPVSTVDENIDQSSQYYMSDDLIVYKQQPDKFYEATMLVADEVGGALEEKTLIMNKPIRKNGWVVYLMSYAPNMQSINVLFKYDPVEIVSLVGIWMIILGSFVICFSGVKKETTMVNVNPKNNRRQNRVKNKEY